MSRIIDADAYVAHVCGETCGDRYECTEQRKKHCMFLNDIKSMATVIPDTVKMNLYDQTEYHFNCAVQILRNSVTGETSIGWTPMTSEIAKKWEENE